MLKDLKWLSDEEMIEALDNKEKIFTALAQEKAIEMAKEALDLDFLKDKTQGNVVPDCFFEPDETFDIEKTARMISDYEIEILHDLIQDPNYILKVEGAKESAIYKESQLIKEYNNDYLPAITMLVNRRLLLTHSSEGIKKIFFKPLMPRSEWLAKKGLELASKDVEEWEMWRDMPNLYKWNNLEVSS